MKLLFDQNLSHRLCEKLSALFPGSKQLLEIKLGTATDEVVWAYARQNDFVLVTTNLDFDALGVLRGHPPKIIRLACRNQTPAHLETLLRQNHSQILTFLTDPEISFLEMT
jgi:predicted nuclease of predicted toxin-antitoxin system